MEKSMHCPDCSAVDLVFDLAADESIYLSFWTCTDCGRRGILRMIDRAAGKHVATHRLPEPPGARGGPVRPGAPARADRGIRSLRHRSA